MIWTTNQKGPLDGPVVYTETRFPNITRDKKKIIFVMRVSTKIKVLLELQSVCSVFIYY